MGECMLFDTYLYTPFSLVAFIGRAGMTYCFKDKGSVSMASRKFRRISASK